MPHVSGAHRAEHATHSHLANVVGGAEVSPPVLLVPALPGSHRSAAAELLLRSIEESWTRRLGLRLGGKLGEWQ